MKLDIGHLETVDDLVNFCKQHLESPDNIREVMIWGEDEYGYMLRMLPTNLLLKLRSELNKPSAYDLIIIDRINKMKDKPSVLKLVLDEYKNRKE